MTKRHPHGMDRIRRQVPFLQSVLTQAKTKQRQAVLRAANKDQINAVSDLVLNALKRNFALPPHVVARARRYKTVLRRLADRKVSLKRRQNLLLRQKGGGFWTSLDHFCQCLRR